MNRCYSLLFLFLLTSFQLSSAQLANVTIQHVCENQYLRLTCPKSNEILQIIRSMYGRTSQRICNHNLTSKYFEKTCANIEQSKVQTKYRCHGQSTCQIFVDNHLFTDPCGSNIAKHFEIHYRCIDRDQICPDLFVNCSKSNDLKCIEKVQEEYSCSCPSTICHYANNRPVGFIEASCPQEELHGLQWVKSSINENQLVSCPSPCVGRISRRCDADRQWSLPNYNQCDCPIANQSDRLSSHRLANGYTFQCNFWLMKRILPMDKSCIVSFTSWKDKSSNCLWSAFQQITRESCGESISFGIQFENLALEISTASKLDSIIRLPTQDFSSIRSPSSNELLFDRSAFLRDYSSMNVPSRLMMIDRNQSMILIEEYLEEFNAISTGNVTVIFHRPQFNEVQSDLRYQCRAYRARNFSMTIDSSDMFFACQLRCANGSHVICQCPFFHPFMHYLLHVDTTTDDDDWRFSMMENSFHYQCHQGDRDSIEDYIQNFSTWKDHQTRAKQLLSLFNTLLETNSSSMHWTRIVEQVQSMALKLIQISNRFLSIHSHLEFFLQSNRYQLENDDRSVLIEMNKNEANQNVEFQSIFFTVSSASFNQTSLNSPIVRLTLIPQYPDMVSFFSNVQITFRHQKVHNQSDHVPICVHLQTLDNNEIQWHTEGCRLMSSNLSHSICSCDHLGSFALLMEKPKPMINANANQRSLTLSKISCLIVIISLTLTMSLLILMRHRNTVPDDLNVVRNIFHGNMFLCLLIVQILFLFGIDQIQNKSTCRIISILLDYFLLATFSWMFVDSIEVLLAFKHPFKIDRIRLIAYSFYSYGFPLLIVFLSIVLSGSSPSTNDYCWSSYNSGYLWAFVVPFLLLIFGHVVFFLLSFCHDYRSINSTDRLRFSLRMISMLSILFGSTWLMSLFYLFDQTVLFGYLFSILNFFHGMFIFLFYCLYEKHIRQWFDQWLCDRTSFYSKYHSFLSRSSKTHSNATHLHEKSLEHFSLPDNTSTSGYSSDLSQKQISSIDCHSPLDPPYLPSIPVHLLSSRLTSYRYPIPSSNELILVREQHEQLLEQTVRHDDDHQYYEIR